jgi:hypothetical protein
LTGLYDARTSSDRISEALAGDRKGTQPRLA